MSRKVKLLILVWFGFSSSLLIVFTLKPIGAINTIKLLIKPLLMNIYTPSELILFDFERSSDFSKWYWQGTLAESSQEHAYRGRYSAKITYYAKAQSPSLILEDYNIGPKGEKEWSYFQFFKFFAFNPQDSGVPLHIKIKDRAGREIDKIFDLSSGENKLILDLEEAGQFIDLHNISYLNFYLLQSEKDLILYLDDICLERRGLKTKTILDKPVVNFIKLSIPLEIKKGNTIAISASLSLSKELRNNYWVFIHITNSVEIHKIPSERHWYINADQEPVIPISKWLVNTAYEIGPISVYIPEDFPSGEYLIQIGLFNPNSHGSYYKGSILQEMMDFRGSFPRLRYTNSEIANYIVGKLRVLD